MKKLAILTHIPFWRGGAGNSTRLESLVNYLRYKTELTVVYGGNVDPHDSAKISQAAGSQITVFDSGKVTSLQDYISILRDYFSSNNFDVYMIEHIELSFLLPALPTGCCVLLDTHDLLSDRIASFRSFGAEIPDLLDILGLEMTEDMEWKTFLQYAAIVLISQPDYVKVSERLGKKRTILAPHAQPIIKRRVRSEVSVIGFVASGYYPNVEAITYFLQHVWPLVQRRGAKLYLYGSVARQLPDNLLDPHRDSIVVRGFVADLSEAYTEIDIAINPVRIGAGLKIKNVEALGNCLPLVTTSHGARGLEDAIGNALLVADTPAAFAAYLNELIDSEARRVQLSNNAYHYAQKNLTAERCFEDLTSYINAQ